MDRLGVTTTNRAAAPSRSTAAAATVPQWASHETHDVVRKARRLSTVSPGAMAVGGEVTGGERTS